MTDLYPAWWSLQPDRGRHEAEIDERREIDGSRSESAYGQVIMPRTKDVRFDDARPDRERIKERTFHTLDTRLGSAAEREGFVVPR